MSRIYHLRQGILGQEVDASETPIRQAQWLTQGTRFFVYREKHFWFEGYLNQEYSTIIVEGSCKRYNVKSTALDVASVESELDRSSSLI